MPKGGGGSNTVTQTTLPDYAKPYVERMFQRAETESQRPYEAYGGQRLADPNSTLNQGRDMVRNMGAGIPGLGQAQSVTQQGIGQLQNFVNNPGFSQAQFSGPGTYTGQNVQQYMSPYMQNVVNIQKDQAMLDFDRQQAGRDAQAVQAGAFGNSRRGVVDALATEALNRDMQGIQARGQQQAFEQGMGMFEQDRAARMAVEAARAGELGRVQAGNVDARLAGMGMTGDFTDRLARLGGAERQAQIEQAGLLQDVGKDIMSEDQARLSQDYQDFLRQQGYGKEQLQFFGDMLRGNIRGGTTSQMDYQQSNPYQQLLGLGLGGLGLQQGMGS